MRIKKKILQQIINCIFSHVRMHSSPCNMALSGQNKLRILDGDNNSGWNCECKYFHGVVCCCCCCCWQWMCQSKAHEEEEEKSDVRAANSRSIRIEWHYDMFCFVCTYSISPRFRGFHVRTCRLTFSAFTWFLLTPRTYRKSGGVLHFSPLTKRFTLFIAECWAAFQCKQAIAIKITILIWANFSTARQRKIKLKIIFHFIICQRHLFERNLREMKLNVAQSRAVDSIWTSEEDLNAHLVYVIVSLT